MIVPGLAFTRQGMRLGRGKGYLDRMLQQDHGRVIALAHECQMISSIPSEPHDQAVDIVITPNETIICQEPC